MLKKIILVMVLSIFAYGCASAPAKGIKPHKKSELYEETETFVILDKGLNKKLYLVRENQSRTEDSRLVVKAKLLNKASIELRIQIQTIFKDKDNYATGDETNWELIIVPANAYYYYEAKAMNNRAEKYVVRCRYAK